MKTYLGKTAEEAIELASQELGTPADELIYEVSDKKKGLFNKKIEVNVYEFSDVVRYAEDYLLNVIDSLGIESTVDTKLDDEYINITIDSTHNPILIGKNGKTLQALCDLTRLATSSKFKRRFRINVDINGYKNHKYYQLQKTARRLAHEVQKTKTTYTFDPMPADERRVIHNACSNMPNIKTESTGEGDQRRLQIIYVE